jgi:hypothetical protein
MNIPVNCLCQNQLGAQEWIVNRTQQGVYNPQSLRLSFTSSTPAEVSTQALGGIKWLIESMFSDQTACKLFVRFGGMAHLMINDLHETRADFAILFHRNKPSARRVAFLSLMSNLNAHAMPPRAQKTGRKGSSALGRHLQ